MTKPKFLKFIVFPVAFLITVLLVGFSVLYFLTPSNFSSPKLDHSHFRLQYIFQGEAENFGSPRYQVDYVKDVCSSGLTESPIHFHDDKDQIVHLHWQKVSGGQILKFYGLNKIGGIDNLMGWKLDDLWKGKLTAIPIHSKSLPQPRSQDKFWIYTGEKDKFEKRDFNDFINKDIESFLGTNSKIRTQFEEVEREEKNKKQTFNPFIIPVLAHGDGDGHDDTPEQIQEKNKKLAEAEKQKTESRNNFEDIILQKQDPNLQKPEPSEEELKDINNLLGNVIIFVQPDEPTTEQVQNRFNKLEPLSKSVCGG